MSTLRTNTITDASGTNSMPVADINQGRAKAWTNFNGAGVIAARDSFNISSLTDNGTGDYSIFPSVAFSNINYTNLVTTSYAGFGSIVGGAPPAVGVCRIYTSLTTSGAQADYPYIYYSAFGDQ